MNRSVNYEYEMRMQDTYNKEKTALAIRGFRGTPLKIILQRRGGRTTTRKSKVEEYRGKKRRETMKSGAIWRNKPTPKASNTGISFAANGFK
jgi:hypothetical protein